MEAMTANSIFSATTTKILLYLPAHSLSMNYLFKVKWDFVMKEREKEFNNRTKICRKKI